MYLHSGCYLRAWLPNPYKHSDDRRQKRRRAISSPVCGRGNLPFTDRQNARFSASICTLPSVKVPSLKFSTFQTGRDNSKRYVIKFVLVHYILMFYVIYNCCCSIVSYALLTAAKVRQFRDMAKLIFRCRHWPLLSYQECSHRLGRKPVRPKWLIC